MQCTTCFLRTDSQYFSLETHTKEWFTKKVRHQFRLASRGLPRCMGSMPKSSFIRLSSPCVQMRNHFDESVLRFRTLVRQTDFRFSVKMFHAGLLRSAIKRNGRILLRNALMEAGIGCLPQSRRRTVLTPNTRTASCLPCAARMRARSGQT